MKPVIPEARKPRRPLSGIIITRGEDAPPHRDPRIAAFIWGGMVRPNPTLPFGLWRGAA